MASGPLTAEQARVVLSATGWLAECPADFAQALLAEGSLRHFGPGEIFNIAGTADAGIWGIAHGQAAGISGINGPSAPVSFFMHPGYWAGTGPLFGFRRIGDGVARTPTSIWLVPYLALKRLLAVNPGWWEHLGALNFRIIRHYGSIAVDLQQPDSRARSAALLLHAADLRHEGEGARTIAITQDELGAMANLSRHPTGEHLRAFERADLIALAYGKATILNPAALRTIANGE